MIPSDDQLALRDAARRFARERLLPGYQARESAGELEAGLLLQMGELGLLGIDLSPEDGGMGVDAVTSGIVIEELAYGDFNVASLAVVQSLCGAILAKNGSAALRGAWLPRLCRGEAILALSVTEPHAGSDAGAIRLRARREGDCYVLDGEKTSTTYADSADAFVVFARVGDGTGADGVTALLVPAATPGITATRFRDLGSHVSGRGSLFFDAVRVPVANLLGTEEIGRAHV